MQVPAQYILSCVDFSLGSVRVFEPDFESSRDVWRTFRTVPRILSVVSTKYSFEPLRDNSSHSLRRRATKVCVLVMRCKIGEIHAYFSTRSLLQSMARPFISKDLAKQLRSAYHYTLYF